MLKPIRIPGALFALIQLLGCAGPELVRDSGNLMPNEVSQATAVPVPNTWWRHFEDETLNTLVEQALADNFSLQSVKARVERSAALALRDKLGLPAQQGNDGTTLWAEESSGLLPAASVAMSYELDLWERLPSMPPPANSAAFTDLIELNASAITLSANVANSYFALSKGRAELDLLERQVATSRQMLELVESARAEGRATPDEVLRQRLWVDSAESRRIQAQAREQRHTHQLAVLVGKPVSQFELPASASTLQPLPSLPADDLPAEWLQRRPDIQASFLRIRSTDTGTAEAIASGLPPMNLYSILTRAAVSPNELVQSLLVGVASRLSAPILDRFDGYLDVNLHENADQSEQARADFRQNVLTAVQEVEDALVTERHDRELLNSLSGRLYTTRRVFHHLRQRYAEGEVGFFEVFTALRDVQALEQQHLSTRLELMLGRVSLARALAGGWSQPQNDLQKLLRSASL